MKEKDNYIELLESMLEALQHQTDQRKVPIKELFTHSCDISRINCNQGHQNTENIAFGSNFGSLEGTLK